MCSCLLWNNATRRAEFKSISIYWFTHELFTVKQKGIEIEVKMKSEFAWNIQNTLAVEHLFKSLTFAWLSKSIPVE